MLPKVRRASFAESLEQRMRASNVRFKRRFPESEVRRYGTGLLRSGCGAVVLGHFHEQHVLEVDTAAARGRIVVLPLWKDGHVHATFDASGALRFETFPDVAR